MADNKIGPTEFDPQNPNWHGRLWVRVESDEGPQLLVNWRRITKLIVILAILGWLGLAGAVWGFVKYKRGVHSVSFVDIAFLPLRYQHYRQNLSHHYLELGRKQLSAGQWSQAVFSLRQAVAKDPHNPTARLSLAGIFDLVQRPDLSIKTLEAGLPEGRDNLEYVRALFTLLQKQGEPGQVITLGRKILPDKPDGTAAHLEIVQMVAEAEISRGNFAEAKALVKEWFRSGSIKGVLLLAQIDEASGYADLAAMQLEALLRHNPKNERVCIQLIRLYQRSGHLNEARRVATMRSLQHPDSPGAGCDLISLLFQTGATSAAQHELDGYFTKFSHDERALMLISSAALRLKLPALARQVCQHAPKDEQGRVALPFLLAEMAADNRAEDYTAALKVGDEIDQYGSLAPTAQGGLYQLRCWACYGLGQNGDAESWLNQFLDLGYSAFGRDALTLAARLREIKAMAPARRILQTLLERNSDDRPALLALVQLDVEQQSWSEVSRRVPQLLALDPVPSRLLQSIWQQGQGHLRLTPDLEERLRNLAR